MSTATRGEGIDVPIVETFGRLLPYSEAADYQRRTRVLDRVDQWLRLG